MADFALIALEGAYHSSVGALLDSFALARDRVEQVFSQEDRFRMDERLRVLSIDGRAAAMSDGRQLQVDGAVDPNVPFAFIWLPAFRAGGREAMDERLRRAGPLLAWLTEQTRGGAIIGASGASALLLMAAKLTEGRAIPVARALLPLAREMFPHFREEERLGLVDYGQILIAKGIAGDLSLIVRALERVLAPDVGRWLVSIMALDREEQELVAIDPLVANGQIWLEQRFTGDVSIAELARHLSTSHPTLIRRFRKALGMTPREYVQQLRLGAAQRMLETSNRSIERIAALVGFSDSRLFRAMFRERTGMTASAWREEACRPGARRRRGAGASS